MRRLYIVLGSGAILAVGAWLGANLWGEAARERSPVEPQAEGARPVRGAEELGLERLRQRFEEMTATQKTAVLRELLAAIRHDVDQRVRRDAIRRFNQADVDKDGKLSFEEVWEAGLFRADAAVRRGRAETAEGRRPGEAFQRMPRPRAESPFPGQRRPPVGEGEPAEFPTSELEQQLLESWELLQELDVLSEDAGE